jgi:HAMP domain-containing protein
MAGDSVVSFLDLEGPLLVVFAVREVFFETGLLTVAFRAGRALLAAGLFAELFFLVGFAIAGHFLNRQRRENGRLIKNISRIAQADSLKKFTTPRNASILRENY